MSLKGLFICSLFLLCRRVLWCKQRMIN